MSNLLKFGLVTAFIGAAMWGVSTLHKASAAFDFKALAFGPPTVSKGYLTVPIIMEFINPSGINITLDSINIDIFIKKGQQWIKAATVNQPITIEAGTTKRIVYPVIDLKQLFGGNVFDTINSVLESLKVRTLEIKAEVTGRYSGISIPKQYVAPQTIAI